MSRVARRKWQQPRGTTTIISGFHAPRGGKGEWNKGASDKEKNRGCGDRESWVYFGAREKCISSRRFDVTWFPAGQSRMAFSHGDGVESELRQIFRLPPSSFMLLSRLVKSVTLYAWFHREAFDPHGNLYYFAKNDRNSGLSRFHYVRTDGQFTRGAARQLRITLINQYQSEKGFRSDNAFRIW